MRLRIDVAIALGAALALAACGGQPRLSGGPGPARQKGEISDWPVKVGNPYQVLGQWYYPRDDARYDETGVASWYGPKFHGLSTANGEPYDMEMVSAAHKTLPLPSYVEVTNLENGRRLVVRVNDRGPFVGGRIIDLSRKSAELLGVERQGTARVRVRRVYPAEDVKLALRQGRRPPDTALAFNAPPLAVSKPPQPVTAVATPAIFPMPQPVASGVALVALPPSVAGATPIAPAATPVSPAGPAQMVQRYIQVAAVSDMGRASWLAGFLKAFGTPVIQPVAGGLTRVRIGPYASAEDAQAALAKLKDAGYQDARIVTGG